MPGGVPQWVYGLDFPPILAGESITCAIRYSLDEDIAKLDIPITWRVRTFTEADPNPDNDIVEVIFNVAGGGPQTATPVPGLRLAAIGILWLAMLMLGAAAAFRTRIT